MTTRPLVATLAIILPALAACGSTVANGSGGTTTTATGSGGDASTTSSTASTTTSSTGSTTDACAKQCADSLACAPNSEFCAADAAPVQCGLVGPSLKLQACGVPLPTPDIDVTRSTNVMEFAGSGPPDVGCFAPAGYPAAPGASQPVTMSGIVRIVSHGCESKGVTIEVHRVKRTGGVDDGAPDALVGAATTTPTGCVATGVAIPDAGGDCGTVYACKYSYAAVPTETELVIKTSGVAWAPVYEYNVFLPNAAVKNGAVTRDVRALSIDDFVVFPQAAIGGPMAPGNGMVMGEVHDCGDVRLVGAVVGVDKHAKIVTYTTSNEAHPLPDIAANSTSALGMYMALDLAAGPVRVAAGGRVEGVTQTLGFTLAQVIPDAVSMVTFHGVMPYQVP